MAGDPHADDPTIVWGLGLLDLDGPWSWLNLATAATEVHEKMCQSESMRESTFSGSGGRKFIPLGNLCCEAQSRLADLRLDDLDGLWELRLTGVQRIWGHRRRHVFYPLWWDPLHEVCPSYKKRT